MRILAALAGALLWIVAGLLGLVGVLLCVTLILLPLGIPVLMLARKLFGYAMWLMLPRKFRHPVDELGKSAKKGTKDTKKSLGSAVDTKPLRKAGKKAGKKATKTAGKVGRSARKQLT